VTLLEEIIDGASGKAVDLPTLLRRWKVLAARLGSAPAEEWLEWELDGYPEGVAVPPYRKLPMQLQGDFHGPTHRAENFIIPLDLVPEHVREGLDQIEYRRSVSGIEHLLESAAANAKGAVHVSLGSLALHLHHKVFPAMQCTAVWGVIGTSPLVEVLSAVRNRVLNMSLALWKEIPDAGAASAKATQEVEMRATQIINNYISGSANVVGTAHNSSIILNVTQGDVALVRQALQSSGVPSGDLDALQGALEDEPRPGKDGWGPKVSLWFGRMMTKAADGNWKIATTVASSVLTKVINKYYGLE
jgi:hypothetical protein